MAPVRLVWNCLPYANSSHPDWRDSAGDKLWHTQKQADSFYVRQRRGLVSTDDFCRVLFWEYFFSRFILMT